MISFYPGPSQVYARVPKYIQDAYRADILSMNHRSPACMILVKQTIEELKKKLRIPKSYTVLFLSSATECWEVLAQSLVAESSTHIYTGAFGKKWFNYTHALKPGATFLEFDREEELPIASFSSEMLCITQNETSNGTQVSMPVLKQLRSQNPNIVLAIDATSSMGGQALDFSLADVWFASVQKCFGLPAGLAVMICSPRAIAHAKQLNESVHYNSLRAQVQFMEKFQTTHTPNVLGIYLLYRVLQDSESIGTLSKRLQQQAQSWYNQLDQSSTLQPLIKNPLVRSQTVVAVSANNSLVKKSKTNAQKNGFQLGDGYGDLKETTFRIANFPAIKPGHIKKLMRILK
jgi:phosphoserine aminotransferase